MGGMNGDHREGIVNIVEVVASNVYLWRRGQSRLPLITIKRHTGTCHNMTMRGGSSWFSLSSRVSARRSPVMSASDSQSDSESSSVAGAVAGRSHETESGSASPNISETRAEAWCECDSYRRSETNVVCQNDRNRIISW